MAKTTMRLDDANYHTLVRAVAAERWFLANLVETAALRGVLESSLVDNGEMPEITSRPELVRRHQTGSVMPGSDKGGWFPPYGNLKTSSCQRARDRRTSP